MKDLASIRHIPTRIKRYLDYASEQMIQNPADAERAAGEALQLAQKQRSRELQALAGRTLGLSHYYARHYAEALSELQAALQLYEKLKDFNLAARSLQNIGLCYMRLGQYESALHSYQRSYQLLKKTRDDANRALVLINMAVLYTTMKNPFKAFEAYSECLEILEQHNNESSIAVVSGNLGQMFMEMGENDKALQWMERCLEGHRRLSNARGEAFALREIGSLHQRIGKQHEAQLRFNEALSMCVASNDPAGQAQIHILMAELYEQEERFAKALEHCEQARRLFTDLQDRRNIARSYSIVGKIASAQKKAKESRHAYEVALEQIGKTDHYAEQAEIQFYLADSLSRTKLDHEAHRHLAKALRLADKHELLGTQAQCHRLLSQLFEREHDLKKALRHARLAQDAQSRLEQQLTSRKVQDLKYRVDIAKVERERELIRQQSEQYRSQLENKSKELNASALALAQKNEVISSLKQRIQNYSRSSDELQAPMKDLMRLVDEHLRGDKQMEGVTKQLSDFHQDFLSKLSAEFKNLTPTEIKICSLLKLNLNTKEIADFLCVSFKSVEVYRARIRKKLGLKEGDNLSAFIVGYDAN